MPKISVVEKKIYQIEKVQVKFMQEGNDVRSDKVLPVQYELKRAKTGSSTVNELITQRLEKKFPGYKFVVLLGDGQTAPGQTLLSTVRSTYSK